MNELTTRSNEILALSFPRFNQNSKSIHLETPYTHLLFFLFCNICVTGRFGSRLVLFLLVFRQSVKLLRTLGHEGSRWGALEFALFLRLISKKQLQRWKKGEKINRSTFSLMKPNGIAFSNIGALESINQMEYYVMLVYTKIKSK